MPDYKVILSGVSGVHDISSKTISGSWNRSLGDSSATLDLECQGLSTNYALHNIELKIDGVVKFKGVVKSQEDTKDGNTNISSLACVDNTDKLQRRIVARTYTQQTPQQIIVDLISYYVPWCTTYNVQEVSTTPIDIQFNYETLTEAINKMAEMTGAYWYLDENNDVHFFLEDQGESLMSYDSTKEKSMLKGSLTINRTALDLANRIWIVGAEQAGHNQLTQVYRGDGVNNTFTIPYEPNDPVVLEAGISKTIEAEQGTSSDKDYVYNKREKTLRRVAGPLPAGTDAELTYRPTVQIIDYFEDPQSVDKNGLYEKVIKDRKITDKELARRRGRAELKRTANPKRVLSFDSLDWDIEIGKKTRIKVSSSDIDSVFRVNSVDVNLSPEHITASLEVEEVV
nr:hypothetical protein 4 [bacterium]